MPITEVVTRRQEIARNTRVSKIALAMYDHPSIVLPASSQGLLSSRCTKFEKTVMLSSTKEQRSPSQQIPKVAMTILLCKYTADTRRRNKRDIAGTAIMLATAANFITVYGSYSQNHLRENKVTYGSNHPLVFLLDDTLYNYVAPNIRYRANTDNANETNQYRISVVSGIIAHRAVKYRTSARRKTKRFACSFAPSHIHQRLVIASPKHTTITFFY